MTKLNVGVLGATGMVGREMLEILIERGFAYNNLYGIASQASAGKQLVLSNEQELIIEAVDNFNFAQIDILLASAGSSVSEKFVTDIAKSGVVVIDNSAYFRTDPLIPLLIPEVNPHALAHYNNKNIIANPNCSTIIMLMAIAPLHRIAQIKRIIVSSYQSVSGAGNKASDELFEQTRAIYQNKPISDTQNVFTKQIAFNTIPHIDKFMPNRYTKEEWKMDFETKKILEADFNVSATCVRVPVFVGHALSVTVEFDSEISIEQAKQAWSNSPGVKIVDYTQDEGYVTQVEAAGEDDVYISRVRKDIAFKHGLNFWVVGDNLRKGAALNAVQIAEMLVKQYF